MERPTDDADILSSCAIERHQIVHEGRQGVDYDTGCCKRHDAVTESLPSEARLELLYDLIVANVNIEMMVELRNYWLGTLILVTIRECMLIIVIPRTSLKEGIVVMPILIIPMVEGGYCCGVS